MKTLTPVVAALVVAGLGVGMWFLVREGNGVPGFGGVRPTGLSAPEIPYTGEPLSADYRNTTFGFSLKLPEGFAVSELPADEQGGTAIVLQDAKGEGIQIYIVPADGGQSVLTAEDIRAALPDLMVESPETVEIGTKHKGVAFRSDNDAFGGDSREVWFYFRGDLYQISTYARLDGLLKAMFSTWTFL